MSLRLCSSVLVRFCRVDLRLVAYIELHTSSAFSFLRGASLPETLIERAAALGLSRRRAARSRRRLRRAALSSGGQSRRPPRHHRRRADDHARSPSHIRDPVNPSITRSPDHPQSPDPPHRQSTPGTLPVLVESTEGWRNLCRLVTRMKLRAPKGEGALTLGDFEGFTSGLVALAGRPLLAGRTLRRRRSARSAHRPVRTRATCTSSCSGTCGAIRKTTTTRWRAWPRRFACRLVATGGVRFAAPEDRPLFDVLTTIREHTTLDAAGPPAGRQRRALSEAARADGAALRRSSRTRSARRSRWPSGCSSR